MRDTFLRFAPPAIGDEEIAEVIDTLRSGWITTGPKTKAFEEKFREFIGAPAALAVNSCTAALHCGLAALGVGPGDVVITTTMTFVSCAHVIEQMGARPILVDVEPDTLNIDPAKVDAAARSLRAGERLAAIMPVHLYGHPCDRNALLAVAAKYGAALIEDAAHTFPAKYCGQMIGAAAETSVPVLTAFSFYATKNLSTGEGGMLTGPRKLIDEAALFSLHGLSRDAWKRYGEKRAPWHYDVVRSGFKENMSDIQAALGLAQLRKIPQFHERRAEIARRYNAAFGRMPELEIPAHRRDVEHAWHIYALRLNLERLGCDRAQFIEALGARNIASSVHFIPVHMHTYYREHYGFRSEDFPVASAEFERLVSIPIYPSMTDEDVDDVMEAVGAVVAKCGVRATAVA